MSHDAVPRGKKITGWDPLDNIDERRTIGEEEFSVRHFKGHPGYWAVAGPDAGKQIEQAYLLALCRPVTVREKTEMLAFLQRETEQRLIEYSGTPSATDQAKARREALQQMCRVILNLNEFAYAD